MDAAKKILVINLGSTSSKIAYCQDAQVIKQEEYSHDTKQLRALDGPEAVAGFYGRYVDEFIEKAGLAMESLDAIAVRGIGKEGRYRHGAYRLDSQVLADCSSNKLGHMGLFASTVIGGRLAQRYHIPAFLYDVVPTDEVMDIARITGIAGYQRRIASHTLNCRAVAAKVAEQMGLSPRHARFIVTHMGGGFGTMAYQDGTIIETYSAEEGSFTPERPGRIPSALMTALYTDPAFSKEDIQRILKKETGMYGHLGTSDCVAVEQRIAAGDEKAKLVYQAMAYQVSKDICSLGAVFCGKLDAIILTGGVAHSKLFTGWIEERVGFLAPVKRMPGAFEIEALAAGVTRVLKGEEPVNDYQQVPAYKMFL